MQGRVAILGATGGIGAALARRVSARGATPLLLARDPARLAAIGVSAGGHVSTSLAIRHSRKVYAPVAAADALDA